MSWLHAANARLRLLLARRAAETRMKEEFRFHLEMETERLVRDARLEPNEARRRALAAFGGVENHKEALRNDRGLAWLAGMSLDLKLGLRMMLKFPGLTLVGVLGMAVAVAIGAVSFGIIYTLIGTTVPLDGGDRIVTIQNLNGGSDDDGRRTHLHDLGTWRDELRLVDAIGAYRTVDRNLITPRGRPEPVRIAEMSASGFRIARVPPLVGRYFNDEDERKGAPPVVVIGYAVWQNRFAARGDVVGQTLQLGSATHTVIGVMPEGFAFPVNNRVWTPLKLDPVDFERGKAPAINVFARLTPTASLDEMRAQLTTIGQRLAAAYPATHEHVRPRALPYALSFTDSPELAWVLHVVQGLVSMLLVVIGTNVAILVYARTAGRAGEIAVRTALGASRRRIVAQLFSEALVLTGAAATVGLFGAWIGLRYVDDFVAQIGGEQLPFWMHFGISPGMVVYVAGLAVLAAVIVGVLPALKATRRDVRTSMHELGATGFAMRLGRMWSVLIVGQVAVAVALLPLVLYVLLVQQDAKGAGVPQFSTVEWMTASLRLDREGVASEDPEPDDDPFARRYASLEAELVRRLEAEPNVSDVVLMSAVPGRDPEIRIEVDGAAASINSDSAAAGAAPRVGNARVDIDFFAAFGVPVMVGRGFQPGDLTAEATAVIVNRSFVRRILGGADPLGRRVREIVRDDRGTVKAVTVGVFVETPNGAPFVPKGPWYEIVGVVPDFPSPESATDVRPRMYHALGPGAVHPVTLALRVRGSPPATFGGRVREIAVAVDPMLRFNDVRALDESASIDKLADRFVSLATVLVTLSVILLSAAGIYALMSFTVTRRRREIGIRTALGAGHRRVITSILARAAGQIAIGIGVGIVLAGLIVQGMEGGLADVRGLVLLAAVAVFMAAVGLVAAVGPARRALQIQPTEALKSQ